MDEIEIRRLYISDDQWERTSSSWKALKPKKNFNEIDLSDETVQEDRERLLPKFDIPLEVLDQWLYGLYYNSHTVDNYGWLDYRKCSFSIHKMDLESIAKWRSIDAFEHSVETRETSQAYDQFMCTKTDLDHWKSAQTWRVPPIILDVATLPKKPEYADIGGHFQLVEGHNRLGYLLSIRRCGKPLLEQHRVYVMQYANLEQD